MVNFCLMKLVNDSSDTNMWRLEYLGRLYTISYNMIDT